MRQESIWNKRIPTLFALVLLILGVSVTAFITRKNTIFRSGAAPSETPKNIRVTNSTDTSFTVTFTTDTPTLGSISFGKDNNLRTILLDDRDQTTNTPHEYTTHSITVKSLSASTQYYFSVISGDTTYTNNGVPFNTTTGPPLSGQSSLKKVISGTVMLPTSNNGSGVLVYVQTPSGEPLSTLSDLQGNYHISLENLRTANLQQYASLQNTDVVSLTFTDGTALSHVSATLTNNLIPTITLSQDYNFTASQGQEQAQSQPIAENFPLFSALPSPNMNEVPVMQTATPSATAVPTLTVTPTTGITSTPTQTIATTTTPTQGLTTTPTIGATATPAPTIGATATPPISPTAFIPSPTKAPLPSTGNDSIFTIGVVSIIMTIIGFGLFFVTRGANEL